MPTTTNTLFGFAEPVGETATLESADIIFVPALAAEFTGNRLGKGKGFYDRALTGAQAPVAAVIYQHELLDAVPAEPHDARVRLRCHREPSFARDRELRLITCLRILTNAKTAKTHSTFNNHLLTLL
jgi:hypothetical protein